MKLNKKKISLFQEFVFEIRIEAFKLTRNMNSEQIEKIMTAAFIEWLANQKVAVTVKALNPSNLDNAYKLEKK